MCAGVEELVVGGSESCAGNDSRGLVQSVVAPTGFLELLGGAEVWDVVGVAASLRLSLSSVRRIGTDASGDRITSARRYCAKRGSARSSCMP